MLIGKHAHQGGHPLCLPFEFVRIHSAHDGVSLALACQPLNIGAKIRVWPVNEWPAIEWAQHMHAIYTHIAE
jgi:hypothetical protein